jgi:predicted TIM-barrel fold metal-dependent hydrolase
MRNGFHVYDSDTHVNPAAEVLERYVDPAFRPRLQDLAPYRVPVGATPGGGTGPAHVYRVGQKLFRRILGEADPHPTFTGTRATWKGSKQPRPGVQDDQAANRIQDMDDEGADVHFLIPTSWTSLVGLDDVTLEVGIIRAYHRHMADFCGQFPGRLQGPIVASTRAVDEAVREIRQWGTSKWAVAVMPLLGMQVPVDHPSLEPIWQAAQDHDLPIMHHSFTWTPPYFPGYQDLWENIFLGRLASHPWGAMRFVGGFIGAGIMDRYPQLRMGILECGFGWLPFWARRMNEQAGYVGGTAPLKHACSDYLTSGRFFCSIEMHEGEDMFNAVTSFLGDNVLMYASDYPHSECHFPDSIDHVLHWSSLKPETRQKLLWDNARRFYKQT